ncbi:hypothetical protein [Phytohabitans rumicis]|uniref:Heparinase n=1 Tax=Phytohabitans rumicis TaxID=1076125 RepID=A0A6V8LFB4_9ACTN|nr:hypothetical protein [Phytohabitans rumicis]GFJ94350.1 hypothetical protein Prum_079920 [Phytohabitans rumicis]
MDPLSFPAAGDPAWAAVHDQSIVDAASKALGQSWPELTATGYLRYRRDGDRVGYETPYFARRDRLATAVLAAAMTGRDDLLDDVVDGIWLLCEESTWCLPAHERAPLPDPDKPVLDLFAAETGGLLAYTDLVLGARIEAVAPGTRERLRRAARSRILAPYHEREEWWYAGVGSPLNNWNPWIHSNVLAVALLLGPSDVDQTLARVRTGLDNYLAVCPPDGGCDEGVAYWWRAAASLFECAELLGRGYDPVLRRMARYPLVAHVAGSGRSTSRTARPGPSPAARHPRCCTASGGRSATRR